MTASAVYCAGKKKVTKYYIVAVKVLPDTLYMPQKQFCSNIFVLIFAGSISSQMRKHKVHPKADITLYSEQRNHCFHTFYEWHSTNKL